MDPEQHDREMSEVLRERDEAVTMADRLADAIANITGVDIGEHSNCNDPWVNALEAAQRIFPAVTR